MSTQSKKEGPSTQPTMNAPPYRGVDLAPDRRPGVPKEAAPHPLPGTHWQEPDRQPGTPSAFLRGEFERPTPVFGTAQPPRGLSGALRGVAYGIPDHLVRHWVLLILADRVDVVESSPVLRWVPVGAGIAAAGLWLARRSSRRSRRFWRR